MKRIAIAVFIGITCFYGIVFAEPVEVVPPQNKILGSYSGRFVFGQISGLGRDQYMLDTQTGRLWQLVETKDKSTLLQMIPYRHLSGDLSVVSEDLENAVVYQLMQREVKKDKTKK